MPTVKLPLAGSPNQRGIDGDAALALSQDQRFLNTTFDVVTNAITGKSTFYVQKRPGWGQSSIPAAGSASTGLIKPQSFTATLAAFGETNSVIYFGTSSVGTITGRALHFTETLISTVGCVAIKSSDGTGWYYMDGAKDVTAYTMDGNNSVNVTDIKISGATNTAGLYPGQKLTAATNIVAGTRVVSVDAGAFTAVLDTATTGGAFNDLAVTKEPIAKIIDADFVTTGTYIGAFVPMDGYMFYPTDDGNVRNSDLNSISAHTAGASIAVQQAPDPTVGVAVQKNILVAFGTYSNEKFQNAGFTTAPLQPVKSQVDHVGALDQRSITTLEDDIYFVSTPSEGDVGVYRMRGLQSQRVSPPHVDEIIGTAASNGSVYASSFRLGGYPYATFTLSLASDGPASYRLTEGGDYRLIEGGTDRRLLEDTAGQTASFVRQMVYNAALNIWGEWDSDEATFIDSVGSGTANQLIATSRFKTDGKVYTINPVANGELYQDDGAAYTMEIRTSKVLDGDKRKFVSKVCLGGWDAKNTTMPYLSYSDDDFQTYSTPRQFTLVNGVPTLFRCGAHVSGRSYKISDSANVPFRASTLDITYAEGTA